MALIREWMIIHLNFLCHVKRWYALKLHPDVFDKEKWNTYWNRPLIRCRHRILLRRKLVPMVKRYYLLKKNPKLHRRPRRTKDVHLCVRTHRIVLGVMKHTRRIVLLMRILYARVRKLEPTVNALQYVRDTATALKLNNDRYPSLPSWKSPSLATLSPSAPVVRPTVH